VLQHEADVARHGDKRAALEDERYGSYIGKYSNVTDPLRDSAQLTAHYD